MAAKDLYAALGIQRGAKPDEIKKAYRRLARKHHPDVNPGDKSAEERFKDISQAHDILSDPDKRKIYDEFGMEGLQSGFDPERARAYDEWAARRQSSAGAQGTSGGFGRYERFEDIFGDLFGGAAHTGPQAGTDIEAAIEIDLLDAIRGLSREIGIDRPVECTVCHGTGNDPASETVCPECHGSGHVQVGQGPVTFQRTCPRCGGAGRIATKRCQACSGQGHTSHRERLQVHIPAGVDNGSRVRVAGKGAPGHAGGAAGDLYLVIRVRPHPRLERRGNDLYLDVPISVGEAVLGGSITVPTPRGDLRVKVPAGSQSGKLLRIPKRGVPAPKGGEAGNLYMRLMIQVPETGSDQLHEAIRTVDAAYGRDLRGGLRF